MQSGTNTGPCSFLRQAQYEERLSGNLCAFGSQATWHIEMASLASLGMAGRYILSMSLYVERLAGQGGQGGQGGRGGKARVYGMVLHYTRHY